MKVRDILRRIVGNADSAARSLQAVNDKLDALVAGCANETDVLSQKLDQIIAGLDNQSGLLGQKFDQIIAGLDNHSELLDRKFEQIIAGLDNQPELLNRKFDQVIAGLDNQSDLLNQKFDQIIAGLDNHSELLNRKFDQVIAGLENQSDLLSREFYQMAAGVAEQSTLLNRKFDQVIRALHKPDRSSDGSGNSATRATEAQQVSPASPRQALARRPLLIAERTYNTFHPDYDARVVRNFPGHFFNHEKPCENAAFRALGRLAQGDDLPDEAWPPVFGETLIEAASVPYAAQVFERRSHAKQYLAELNRKYRAHYLPGWVNLDDALFLYWLVRQVKPRTIVQTGVCNGLSAAFMMLGLVKNGPEGRLHAIDLPAVFNAQDPAWTVEGKVYDFVIPEGKASGWLIPEAYRERFELWTGDATKLLPKMVDKVDSIDFFYHDSDHSYNHMMFEFHQAKRKLGRGGLVVNDDVSWNASLWDFADEVAIPSYNFKGTLGVAFF